MTREKKENRGMPENKLNSYSSLGNTWVFLNAEPQTVKSQFREVMKFAHGPQLVNN